MCFRSLQKSLTFPQILKPFTPLGNASEFFLLLGQKVQMINYAGFPRDNYRSFARQFTFVITFFQQTNYKITCKLRTLVHLVVIGVDF
jgi:hypothetical protein